MNVMIKNGRGPTRFIEGNSAMKKIKLSQWMPAVAAVLLVGSSQVGAAPMAYHDAVIANSPYAYYRVGESSGTTAADSSGNLRDASYTASGITYNQAGQGGGDTAVTFDGTSGYVSVPTASMSGFDIYNSSYEVLFKTPANYSTASGLVGEFNTGFSTGAQIILNNGGVEGAVTLYFRNTGNNADSYNFTNANLCDGNYHMLTATFASGTTIRAYVDGVRQGSGGATS